MKRRIYLKDDFRKLLHGGDYNPEQWIADKSIWDEDMRLMKLAHCNEMTVGIFSWSALEPKEGEYDFSFLDEILDKVYSNGGRVILATPSGARPHWLADKYPEVPFHLALPQSLPGYAQALPCTSHKPSLRNHTDIHWNSP